MPVLAKCFDCVLQGNGHSIHHAPGVGVVTVLAAPLTTRTPGPSTVEPVVNECRNPISPVSRAFLTRDSGTSRLWSRRSSKGLLPSSGALDRCGAELM